MKDERGFLLIEAMLALVVLSVGIVMVFRAFSSCLSAAQFSRTRYAAALIAEGNLWELEQWGQTQPTGLPETILERPLRWDLRERTPQDSRTPWRIWELELEWTEGTRRETFALEAYIPQ